MVDLLLYTTLTCTQTQDLIDKVQKNENLDDFIRVELVETIQDSAPECDWYWDAND